MITSDDLRGLKAAGIAVFSSVPWHLQKKLRTTNMVEFQNKELKKLTRIIRVFPNKNSLLLIAAAMLIELDEKWQTDRHSKIIKPNRRIYKKYGA